MSRRVKIVVSDFHMGQGRVDRDGNLNDLEDFVSDEAFVDMLEYYRTGEYVDAEVELIINGDFFELIGMELPGDPEPDIITEEKSLEKVRRVLDGHPEVITALNAFADSERRKVTLVVGNHDQDLFWDGVRKLLRHRIHPAIRFVDEVYEFDGVRVEHGHQYERHNRVDPERRFLREGLPEPVLALPWGSDMLINSMLRFKRLRPYVNRVRPFRLGLYWSLVHDFTTLLRGFAYFVAALVRARFRRLRQRRIPFLKTLKVLLRFNAYPTLERSARQVLARERHLHTVIFGHTHVPMARVVAPGKLYLNSGSWIPTVNLHIAQLGRSLLQTYVYLEYEGGQPRARLKVWHGRRRVEEDIVL